MSAKKLMRPIAVAETVIMLVSALLRFFAAPSLRLGGAPMETAFLRRLFARVFIVLTVVGGGQAGAETVFLQPPVDGGVSFGGPLLTKFTLSEEATIGSLIWWGHPARNSPQPNSFNISFFSDTGTGMPQISPFSNQIGQNLSISTTDLLSHPGLPIFQYGASLTDLVSLQGGVTYYLSVVSTTGRWGWANGDPQSPGPGLTWIFNTNTNSYQVVGGAALAFGLIVATAPKVVVNVDIEPGRDPNNINLCSNRAVTVAVLGSETFDVLDINTETLRFAEATVKVVGKKDPHILCSYEDVNDDFENDLVCDFLTTDIAGIGGESTTAMVNGELIDGTLIEGTDSFEIVKDTCN